MKFRLPGNVVSDSPFWRSRFNRLSQWNKVSLATFVPPCVREIDYGLRGDTILCNSECLVEDLNRECAFTIVRLF